MKNYFTLEEISEMKANGYEKSNIDYFTAVYEHYQPLLGCIYEAFAGVKLEDGVGIWEGEAIDNYASKDEYARYKAKDEREDWIKLINDDLNTCFCSLSFLDAKGMRFCLPAYMIGEITEVYNHDVMFHLTHRLASENRFSPHTKEKFSLFNRQQKDAVIQYMTYPVAEVTKQRYKWNDAIEADVIQAIENFWEK